MTPKRKRLKWVADQFRANMGRNYYWLIRLPRGLWSSGSANEGSFQGRGPFVSKRAAIAACEAHAKKKGTK